jgi:hypothetical protein
MAANVNVYLIAGQSQSAQFFQAGEHAALQQRQVVARQLQSDEAFQSLEESARKPSS